MGSHIILETAQRQDCLLHLCTLSNPQQAERAILFPYHLPGRLSV